LQILIVLMLLFFFWGKTAWGGEEKKKVFEKGKRGVRDILALMPLGRKKKNFERRKKKKKSPRSSLPTSLFKSPLEKPYREGKKSTS